MRRTVFATALLLGLPASMASAAPIVWKGRGEGLTTATITFDPDTSHASVNGSGPRCAAGVNGLAVHKATSLTVTARTTQGECTVRLDIDGAGDITGSHEALPCVVLHGARCSLESLTATMVH